MSRASHVDQSHPHGWLTLFWSTWLVSALICGALAFTPGYESDILHYKQWARKLTLNGVETAYAGKSTRDYVMYPPVFVYVYAAVGHGYAQWIDTTFDVGRMKASAALTAGIKGVAVVAHLALGAAVFALLRRLHSEKWAAIASASYLLNPAVIFGSAVWGAPDGFHSLGIVAACGLGELNAWMPAWVAVALAAACKPQAWILMPLFGFRQLNLGGARRILSGGLVAGSTIGFLILPYIFSQRIGELLTLPSAIAQYMPYASVNAHNIWWLAADGRLLLDRDPWIGAITYEHASIALVLAFTLCVLHLARGVGRDRLFMLAAYQAFGWFCLTTQLHENHSFFVLPLLALALPFDRWAWKPLLAVSMTLLANMLLHDPSATASVSTDLVHRLTMVNAIANIAILAGWTWRLIGFDQWREHVLVGLLSCQQQRVLALCRRVID